MREMKRGGRLEEVGRQAGTRTCIGSRRTPLIHSNFVEPVWLAQWLLIYPRIALSLATEVCSPTSSSGVTWEFVRNAVSGAPSQSASVF